MFITNNSPDCFGYNFSPAVQNIVNLYVSLQFIESYHKSVTPGIKHLLSKPL